MTGEGNDLEDAYVAQALFALSASCEPPSLRPDCPYSVDLAGGVRTCQVQCHAILRGRGIEPPGPDLVPLPVPVIAHAPRAFDASERYMRERGRLMSRWSVSALVWALRHHLTRTPVGVAGPGDPERETLLCLGELGKRGVDVDALVRLALGPYIATALTIATVFPPLPEGVAAMLASFAPDASPQLGTAGSVRSERDDWSALLNEILAEESPGDGAGDLLLSPGSEPDTGVDVLRRRLNLATRGSFQRRLATWLATASLGEIVAWTAPPSDRFKVTSGPDAASTERRTKEATWLLERFTELTYDKWSASSLRLEFLWARAGMPGCCDEQWMRERPVQRLELAETIAAMELSRQGGHAAQQSQLKLKAIEFLDKNQHSEAAVLLDASRRLDGGLPEPHSDFAFCVLPDNADLALEALDRARDLGWDPTVSIGVRVLCLAVLGRDEEALKEAGRVLAGYGTADQAPSYMWDPAGALTGGPWALLKDVSPREYVVDLGTVIADRRGDGAAAAAWRSEVAARRRTA